MIPDSLVDEPVSLSMNPYTGPWTRSQAAHLLRRTLVGPTFTQLENALSAGMNSTVTQLLTVDNVPPPLTYHADESVAAQGATWVNSVYPSGDTNPTHNARIRSLAAWTMQRLNAGSFNIAEKMTLFWVNHFAVEQQFDARSTYSFFKLLRDNCLGNFRQLVKDVTIHPEMLLFLDGATNTLFSPNENFSRELLELYSIGKGPQIGPGDYTYYTEQDVLAGSKILTGWTVQGLRSSTATSVTSSFNISLHDQSQKQLSSKFSNAIVASAGANEYANFIDIIFTQDQCAKFICTKLYRYFVNYDITPSVAQNVIPVMVQTLLQNNYDVLPVMDQLLRSEHFYDAALRGSQIRNPIEDLFSKFNSCFSQPPGAFDLQYQFYLQVHYLVATVGLNYYAPPSVGGWPAYYQTPSFSKLWLNSTSIKQRFDIALWITLYGGITIMGQKYNLKALNLVDSLSNPPSAPDVIQDLCDLYFSKPVSGADQLALKSILTNGLPDFEWTDQYNDYLNNPGNTTFSDPVRQRVELVMSSMYRMAQFQTI